MGDDAMTLDDLIEVAKAAIADKSLEGLLHAMDLSFELSRWHLILDGYYANIEEFEGRYDFEAGDGVRVGVVFSGGEMEVVDEGVDDWHAKVAFNDNDALMRFLLSRDHDVLDSVLRNEVQVEGNLNYVYRFGFLVKDLMRRLKLD
jgi:hypothetical protein